MRLLDTSTPQPELTEFFGNAIPVYAILSHTWGDGEVSYHDLQYSRDKAEKKAGYQKIKESCEIASQYGYRYVWIDTCCIDKTSSAELSEAINSMFGYYRDCRICLAYLSDVASQEDPKRQASAFRRSRWFKRGWTLQELLAPPSLVFFSQDWMDIGTKSSLRNVVSEVTRIPVQVLMNNHPETISIAKRMSWAADRKTTRAEDLAYCLMGIFDVHMPTLYGEGGPNAFMRLQQEIIRKSDDQSIFAWTAPGYECGPFASSPSAFSYTGDVQVWNPGESEELQSPYTMTNLGLRIELLLIH
ncbi:HET-domain-containing protein, partial [Dendrothele bispora CBS 962.96]